MLWTPLSDKSAFFPYNSLVPKLSLCHTQRKLSLSLLIFLGLMMFYSVLPQPLQAAGNKCGVNVGPYYGQVNQVRTLTKAGGWIVSLGTLGDCAGYGSLFGKELNVVIRAYNAGQPFTEEQAVAWTATLGQLDSKGQMIYFMPWNEPNQGSSEGGSSTDGTAVVTYMNALRKHLGDAGLLDTKVTLLSPMLNKTHDHFTQYLSSVGGGDAFYKLASGSSINEYDHKGDGDSTYVDVCRHSSPFKNNCKYDEVAIPGPYYSLESGVFGVYGSPRYEDAHISKMLSGSWSQKWVGDSNFKMFAVFSYDPLPLKGEPIPTWDIFKASQTTSFYNNNCSPGIVTPLNNFDQSKFNTWLESQNPNLTKCGECGFAPKDEPGLCSGVGQDNPAYDLSIYDEYGADNDEFYIHPILGLDPSQPRDVTVIRNDLINQGYEAHCATPGFKIGLTQSGERWMKAWVDDKIPDPKNDYGAVIGGGQNPRLVSPRVPPAETGTWPIRSTLTIDYRDVLVPNFRDVSGKQYLMTSLEEYFGFKDTKISDRTLSLLNSAPANNLLSNRERCIQSLHMLTKQEEMCNKLLEANRDSCALYPRPIPNTDYTIKSLLDEYKTRFNVPDNFYTDTSGKNSFCIDLIGDTDLDESAKKFKTAVLNTPLTMDRAYRPAFLVTSIELSIPSYTRMYNLFTHPLAGTINLPDKPQDAILVNAFKVPDITTNKGTDVATTAQGNTVWNDSAILTRNLVLTKSQQLEYTEKAIERRDSLAVTSMRYDTDPPGQTKDDEIMCLAGGKTGVGGGECNDPLSKALVDIINTEAKLAKENSPYSLGFTPECPELKKESATQITDTGAFGTRESPSKTYTTKFGAELLNNLFLIAGEGVDNTALDSTHQTTPKGKSDPQFAETWKETSEGSADGRDPRIPPISDHDTEVRDYGLKTMFHVVDDPDTSSGTSPYKAGFYPGGTTCCDETKVKHFLVYPEGYDLTTVESTLMGSFFTTEQLVSLTEEAEEYDRFQVSGDILKFVPGFVKREFNDPSPNPPNWNGNPGSVDMDGGGVIEVSSCTPVYSRVEDPPGSGSYINNVQIGWKLPCTRSFEFYLAQKGQILSAGILGGRLGHYLQVIQKTLNTKVSDARHYLDACKSTEQFLRGQCGQTVTPVATNPPEECTTISCMPPPAPPQPFPPGQTCSDPTQQAMVVDSFMTDSREWKFAITCPTCTGDWGDIAIVATGPGINCNWAGGFLPVQGRLEYPTSAEPTMCYGSKIPDTFHGNFCINLTITSRPADNQCQGTINTSTCFEVP